MYVVIWKFEVKPGAEQKFEAAYHPNGLWAKLFRQAGSAYIGTELFKDVDERGVYLTIDSWESHEAYEEFLKKSVDEYHQLDEECADLTVNESKIADLES